MCRGRGRWRVTWADPVGGGQWAVSTRPLLESTSHRCLEANEHSLRSHYALEEPTRLFGIAVAQGHRHVSLELQLLGRADGVVEKRDQGATPLSPTALSDVRADRDRGAPHLLNQPVALDDRQAKREAIDRSGQLPSFTVDQ